MMQTALKKRAASASMLKPSRIFSILCGAAVIFSAQMKEGSLLSIQVKGREARTWKI
jgi:hypothetical protein